MNAITTPEALNDVRRCYGEVLKTSTDLKTGLRYARRFRVDGDQSRHLGLFDCAPSVTGAVTAVGPGARC